MAVMITFSKQIIIISKTIHPLGIRYGSERDYIRDNMASLLKIPIKGFCISRYILKEVNKIVAIIVFKQ